jgi:peptidyl-prolyl cis-trans isomerase C
MKQIALALVLILVLAAGCKKEPKAAILAEVNGEVLELETFKASFGEGEWDAMDGPSRRRYVEDWVNLTLLAQAAEKAGLDREPVIKERISYATKKVKANALIAEQLAQMRISEDQLFSYFRVHQAEFRKPAVMYNIQRIALPDKLTAENVLQQIIQGMDFNVALRRYSTENLRESGGMLGFVESTSADSVFWLAARDLELNRPGLLTKDDLWYVFRYTATQESEKEASFEEHRAEIRRKILSEKQEEVYRNLLREVKARSNEIYYY